jgi:hypothetical protein
MRKLAIVAGLLLAGALFGGSQAKAEVGCLCATAFKAPVCTNTISACNIKMGGACVAPCDYQAPKMTKVKRHKKKKAM